MKRLLRDMEDMQAELEAAEAARKKLQNDMERQKAQHAEEMRRLREQNTSPERRRGADDTASSSPGLTATDPLGSPRSVISNLEKLSAQEKDQIMQALGGAKGSSFTRRSGVVKLGDSTVPHLNLSDLGDKDQKALQDMESHYGTGKPDTQNLHLPAAHVLEEKDLDQLEEMKEFYGRRGKPRAARAGPTLVLTPELAAAKENNVSSLPPGEAATVKLEAKQSFVQSPLTLPGSKEDDFEKGEQLKAQSQVVRQAVQAADEAVPGAKMEEALVEAERTKADVLRDAIKKVVDRGEENEEVEAALRKALAMDRASFEHERDYADFLTEAIQDVLRNPALTPDGRAILRSAFGEASDELDKLRGDLQQIVSDTSLPQEIRMAINEAIVSPSHLVSDAVRDVLQMPLPQEIAGSLSSALADYDSRLAELANTVEALPRSETIDEALEAPRHTLPATVGVIARHPSTSPDVSARLSSALLTHQGHVCGVEDAARAAAASKDISTEARGVLRAALAQAGVTKEDAVAEVVRYVLLERAADVPPETKTSLETGLDGNDARYSHIADAVRVILSSQSAMSQATKESLRKCLEGFDNRAGEFAAIMDHIGQHDALLPSTVNDVAGQGKAAPELLHQSVGKVAKDAEITAPLREYDGMGAASKGAVKNAAKELPEPTKSEVLSVDLERTTAVRYALHRAIANPSIAIPQRKELHRVVSEIDAKSAEVACVSRTASQDSKLAAECRAVLKQAVLAYHCTCPRMCGAVRSLLQSHEVTPESRARIHSALQDIEGRGPALVEAVRSIAMHDAELAEDLLPYLSSALAETSGKPAELIMAASNASRNPQVPADIRRMLREALGEAEDKAPSDPTILVEAVSRVVNGDSLREGDKALLQQALEELNACADRLTTTTEEVAMDPETAAEVTELIAQQSSLNAVRQAVQSTSFSHLPEPQREKLLQALGTYDARLNSLTDVVEDAIHNPNTPDEVRKLLAEALEKHREGQSMLVNAYKDSQGGTDSPADGRGSPQPREDPRLAIQAAIEAARSALASLPRSRGQALSAALEAADHRGAELAESIQLISDSYDMPYDERDRLLQALDAETPEDMALCVENILKSHDLPPDAAEKLTAAYSKYRGRETELKAAVHTASKDACISAEMRKQLQDAVEARPAEDVEKMKKMSDQYDALVWDAAKKDDELRQLRRRCEELEKLLEIIDKLGGAKEARRLADDLRARDDVLAHKLAVEQELADLEALAKAKRESAVPEEYSKPDEDKTADAKKEKLRKAYLDGRDATLVTPLPVAYREHGCPPAEAGLRKELTHAWFTGRQEAMGSVVPPDMAQAPGLSDHEEAERAALRRSLFAGLKGEPGETENTKTAAALVDGKTLRENELKRMGVTHGSATPRPHYDDKVTVAFNAGLRKESEEALDAQHKLFADCPNTDDRRNICRAFRRGVWLASDIEGCPEMRNHGFCRRLDNLAADRTRLAQCLAELERWVAEGDPTVMGSLGFAEASPNYLVTLQKTLKSVKQSLREAEGAFSAEKKRLANREDELERKHKERLAQLENERSLEVDRLKNLLAQLETDLTTKNQLHSNLHARIGKLTDQLTKTSEENDSLHQEIVKKATMGGDIMELVHYYKERERKWRELSSLNHELQHENRTLLTESTALAQKLKALSFVFESRPTLVRSLYELYKLLAHIPTTLHAFSKLANTRQLPRLEILDRIKEVGGEVDTSKEGTRWIIANLFTAYELQHLGTSPQFFKPDGKRPTWRDIQVPHKQRELLLSTWQGIAQDSEGEATPPMSSSPVSRRTGTSSPSMPGKKMGGVKLTASR
eukprot:Sspe_Gene.4736::Locus_1558_Transcript_1_1_Confidence_1.000_Length_8260::g.4736::m.4736